MEARTLYKATKSGKWQFWTIWTVSNQIFVDYGQEGGSTQRTMIICEEKNVGKANYMSPEKQAESEADSLYQKKLDKGYSVTKETEYRIPVMLAHSSEDHASKIPNTLIVQAKFDGIRMRAIFDASINSYVLFSRNLKPIVGLDHIVEELNANFKDVSLDGELYNHDYKDNFEQIVSIVRKSTSLHPDREKIQYHVYDLVNNLPNGERVRQISKLFLNKQLKFIKRVKTYDITKSEIDMFHDMFVEDGFEGLMIRDPKGLYVDGRTVALLKYKKFKDGEFKIVGIKNGSGKLEGHVGSFICETADGKIFNVKLAGRNDFLKECYNNEFIWKNKMLTVKYQNLTKDGIPRFPVGIEIRDYE